MTYFKKVDYENRNEMESYLRDHFRYYTDSSWNRTTSYAHNVKVHKLPLSADEKDKLYDILGCEDCYDGVNLLLGEFEALTGYSVGFNGRSGGYIVLYSPLSRGMDSEDDFHEWEGEDLVRRVKLVQSFDRLADDIVAECKNLVESFDVAEETVFTPKTVKYLREKQVECLAQS